MLLAKRTPPPPDTAYGGDAAILVQTRHISGVFECAFDVYNYPFDTQKCFVQFVISKDSGETITVPRNGTSVGYLGPKDLPAFQIGEFGVESSEGERGHVFQVGAVRKVCMIHMLIHTFRKIRYQRKRRLRHVRVYVSRES